MAEANFCEGASDRGGHNTCQTHPVNILFFVDYFLLRLIPPVELITSSISNIFFVRRLIPNLREFGSIFLVARCRLDKY